MARPNSGWNSFFHTNNAYDTSNNATNSSNVAETTPTDPSLQRLSYFQLRSELGPNYDTNIPLDLRAKKVQDVERGGGYPDPNNPFIDSKEATNREGACWIPPSINNNNDHPLPSAPPASDLQSYRNYEGASSRPHSPPSPPSGDSGNTSPYNEYNDKQMLEQNDEAFAQQLYREENEKFYLRPENATYHGAVPDSRNSGIVPLIDPKMPKALSDPRVLRQLQKRRIWRPWFTWLVSIIQVVVLIFEFIKNQKYTGSVIETSPFNPMIGPSSETLILMGARFVPCMRAVPSLENMPFSCPNATTQNATCSLEDYCGFDGFHGKDPNQWYRFILPIFLHGGLIHIAFNLLFQLQTGTQVEKDIGFPRYSIIYMASGIFGFIFGGNFARTIAPSMGASGSLFGIVGVLLLDLIQNWKLILNPCWELTKMLLLIGISFLIGLLLPGLDNFSHIGGFVMDVQHGSLE
ncbi:414_t:CDS:2 [Ambispora gerdemannii]|uniref:Rhomboid-type serine protease n=1 Tax=Ambispora gerdemannii TaxID=144530 RepID=A0A9N8WMW8_9GLOM|nr:414_t:CDS:2 [Ambispora gerdemannii]